MSPALLQALQDLTDADLRQLIATAAGLLADREGEDRQIIAQTLGRIADRLTEKTVATVGSA